MNDFFDKLTAIIERRSLIKLLLSGKKNKESNLKNVVVTIVELKKGYFLNFVYRYNTKDITKNYVEAEGVLLIKEALEKDFLNANVYSDSEDITMQIKNNGKVLMKVKKPSLDASPAFSHDKVKDRLIKTESNTYLRELGIVNADWEIRREMGDKYKQINKYVDLMKPYLDGLSLDGFNIADMGSGKGYLTFALYDYITNTLHKNVKMTGIELRPDLVDTCNNIAKKSRFDNLNFIQGTIKDAPLSNIDILIALHACDTATDDAIYSGITSKASLIVCAPCCHKQIRREFDVPSPLSNVTKYGILKERQAEIITDSIRALLLEASGYKTNVFEFISTEHTPKNVMIVGKRMTNENPDAGKILDDIASIKNIYGIKSHYLETLLSL